MEYYTKRGTAIKSPLDCLSIVIDGMDQTKTGVAHFRGWARAKLNLFFLSF